MKDLDALLEDLASGQPPVQQQASSAAPLAQPPPGWEVRCDVNGCSIVRVQKESSAPVRHTKVLCLCILLPGLIHLKVALGLKLTICTHTA